MPDPTDAAATQLRNIEAATGRSLSDFVEELEATGLAKHGQMVAYLKTTHGLTHGNANLIAHRAREALAGGPPPPDALLDAQYEGPRQHLRPIFERLADLCLDCGPDVTQVVQKTGVSFRRATQFALVQVPSSKRIQLGLNLDVTPDDERVAEVAGMCTHRVVLTAPDQVDQSVTTWIRHSYERAGIS